jgi:mannose-1-phosphate guanylyltransferase
MKEKLAAHAIILAGGRGTRFWPRSRSRAPKQLLNIVGARTMLEQTVARLAPLFSASRLWVVTNDEQAAAVRRQVPRLAASHVLTEPVGRNTAAAIGLAAAHLAHQLGSGGDALMAVLPADHFIAQEARYRRIMQAALAVASRPGALVVLGIPPAHPETGYGYIERSGRGFRSRGCAAYAVRRFTEKPALARARQYVAAGRYYWNAGMFFWRLSTLLRNLERFLPATHRALMRLTETIGTPRYKRTLRRIYPQLQNISVDYAVMEPATRSRPTRAAQGKPAADGAFVLPADVGWSDIGSWAAVYELEARKAGDNVSAGPVIALDANGNYFWTPKKLIAAIGVRDLVVVETPDALLICPRDRAQDVGQIVKRLESQKLRRLL